MRARRGRERLGLVLLGCTVALSGVIAALVLPPAGYESTTLVGNTSTTPAPTTGSWTPITVKRPKLPNIAGGIPVDVDPLVSRSDFSTTLVPLSPRRYRMTIFNASSLGAINSLQWYPPTGVRILKLVGSSSGRCTLTGLKGFGGNQFPTLVLYPNIFCDRLALKPATCMCAGDGGSVSVTFTTNKAVAVNEGDLRLGTATLAFDRIPITPAEAASPRPRRIFRVTPTHTAADGLTAGQRADGQSALDGLQDSNISYQLMQISSRWVQSVPTACRVHLVSQSTRTYKVYLFWVPWLAAEPYVWLNMNVTTDPKTSTFHLGATQPVLPGGRLTKDGQKVNRLSVDTTLLSRYGPEQARKGHQVLLAHAAGAFAKPGASCQVLKNGAIKLL